jgi:hypothetical protein
LRFKAAKCSTLAWRIGFRVVSWLRTKIYGVPPTRDASKLERLCYVRRVAYLNQLPFLVAVLACIAIFSGAPLNWVLPLVIGGVWVIGFVAINLQIRRERGRSVGPSSV